MKRLPLSGEVIVVTRPKAQARPLIQRLRSAGARVIAAPLIRIAPPFSHEKLDSVLGNLKIYDGILFTSRNGVESFFGRSKTLSIKLNKPKRLYAIGPETSRALKKHGWEGATQPKVHRGEALARALGEVRGLKLLIPRAKVAREALPRLLRRKGAQVTVVEAYRTLVDRGSTSVLKKEARGRISAVTFASGSTVDQFVLIFGAEQSRKLFKTARAVSIGPVTSASLRAHGIEPAAQARKATAASLVQAVKDCLKRS